jgi:DNA-binding GntR family transcriptional regulator
MGVGVTAGMVARLERDRPLLAQVGTADRVASLLRDNIMEGVFPPGTRLSEEVIGQALGVSRNTLREAFRLLCHERLAVHELNRGIFVPVLTTEDVVDLYRLRRLVEGSAIRMADQATASARRAVAAGVADGEAAAAAGDWQGVRSADLHFHQAVAALAGSPRVDELMRRALTELRLVFHVMTDPERFHRPFLARNKVIADLVEAGDGVAAEKELLSYLESAEQQLLAAYRAAHG